MWPAVDAPAGQFGLDFVRRAFLAMEREHTSVQYHRLKSRRAAADRHRTAGTESEWRVQYQGVSFGPTSYSVYSATVDSFDLPVLGGDSISIPATG